MSASRSPASTRRHNSSAPSFHAGHQPGQTLLKMTTKTCQPKWLWWSLWHEEFEIWVQSVKSVNRCQVIQTSLLFFLEEVLDVAALWGPEDRGQSHAVDMWLQSSTWYRSGWVYPNHRAASTKTCSTVGSVILTIQLQQAETGLHP